MAIKALNPFAPFWYPLAGQENDPRPTKFKIRGLDGSEIGYVTPEYELDEIKSMVVGLTGKGMDLVLRYGLLDWENFENDSGPVMFSQQNFRLMDHVTRAEVAMQIIAASYVTPEEKKTSPSP